MPADIDDARLGAQLRAVASLIYISALADMRSELQHFLISGAFAGDLGVVMVAGRRAPHWRIQ